jgi:predicted aminopeptidase
MPRPRPHNWHSKGLEVEVYGVPAYSTLGYMNWAGGDPLLSTFIAWPEGEFVRLLFHELAHQVVYAPGDTLFNESFATAVERLGSAQWLATQSTPQARQAFADQRCAAQCLPRTDTHHQRKAL